MNVGALAADGWPCPTADEMRGLDRAAIEECGIPARLLMENAGRAAALAVRRRYPDARRPLVVCGAGNNGGDGFVLARVLAEWNSDVRPVVVALGDDNRRSPESRSNLDLCLRARIDVTVPASEKDIALLGSDCDLAIDAVFGIGLSRAIDGAIAETFSTLRERGAPIIALDVPSGRCATTGAALGTPVEADCVVTFGLPKLGLALWPAPESIWVADIGLPWSVVSDAHLRQHVWTDAAARARLPRRPSSGHKGTFGHLLVVGGSEGKTGAACLAAEGALRAGAGLVTATAPRTLHAVYESKLTEAMTLPLDDAEVPGAHTEAALADLRGALEARDCAVVGPGLGDHPATARLLERLLPDLARPVVVDADGLNAFAGRPESLGASGARVLTPHPGEMGRLLGRPSADVQRDRVGCALELAKRARAVVVLKGARTVVAERGGAVRVNPTGGPALATGGTGDVLAGVIGALLAQGLDPFDAGSLGAYLHGRAGDALGDAGGPAGDVARSLGAARHGLEKGSAESSDDDDLLRGFP